MDKHDHHLYVYSAFQGHSSVVKKVCPNLKITSYEGSIEHFFKISEEELSNIRENATILFASDIIVGKVLSGDNKLQWAQTYNAGVNGLVNSLRDNPPSIPITRDGENFGSVMAEYVVGQIIARERHFREMDACQRERRWHRGSFGHYRSLSSLVAGICGTGSVGTKIAETLKGFGITVHGLCRRKHADTTNTPFASIMSSDNVREFLSICDYVICALPSTTETRGMLSGDVLSACKEKQSYLINIGRGDLISNDTIEKAVNWRPTVRMTEV